LAASQHQKVEEVLVDGNPSVNEMVKPALYPAPVVEESDAVA